MAARIGNSVTGIVATNSCDFIASAIECLNQGKAIVTLRREDDDERHNMVEPDEVVNPNDTTGWISSPRYEPQHSSKVGQIQFTSGTEGEPKPVLISHSALANSTDRLISKMKIDERIREYVGVPVYYSFGFGRCRAVLQAGGEVYIPNRGFDPLELSEMLQRKEINAISAVPSLWRVLLQNAALFEEVGGSVLWIEIGSQYMSAEEKKQVRALFPNARIVQHYGLTEASRTTFLDVQNTGEERLESVGKAEDGVEVRIRDDGRILIRGPHLAMTSIVGGEQIRLTDDDGWLVTSDLGRIEDGYLYYEGRADDLINCAGVKVSPDYLETQLSNQLEVSGALSVAKIPDPVRGDGILIAHLPDVDATAVKSAAAEALHGIGIEPGHSLKTLAVESFPVTETGKVRRSSVSDLYLAEEGEDHKIAVDSPAAGHEDPRIAELVSLWEEVLQIRPVSPHDSFFDLGGDSLSAINVAIRMEKSGIPREVSRQIFEGVTIAQIVDSSADSMEKQPLAATSQSIDAVRGMLALFVVASHWMPGVVERIPGIADANKLLSFFYSGGTPGFAVVFGLGVGFAYLPRFMRSRESVNSLVIRNALLLLAGIVVLAAVRITGDLLGDQPMRPVDYSNAFWGVLMYYMLAVLSIPIWLSWLTRARSFVIATLFLALVFYLIHELVLVWAPEPSANPILQTGILLLTAKFNYFEISTGVLIGLALGYWLRGVVSEHDNPGNSFAIGLLLMLAGFVLSIRFGHLETWMVWPKPIYVWMWVVYTGFVLACTHIVFNLAMADDRSRFTDVALKVMSIVGIMAFPLFIGHELVIPLKDLLMALHVPGALTISMSLFFVSMAYILVRVYKIYY